MANKIMKFVSAKFGNTHGMYFDGQAWLYAKDVCRALGIKNVPDAVARLKDDEKMTIGSSDSHSGKRGGARMYVIVNEPGIYRLIFTSRKPEAEEFQHWVFHEVLPTIRRDGEYKAVWNEARTGGKATRRKLTDAVKEFIEYLEAHGELDRPEKTWYQIFSKLVNRILDISDERDDLPAKTLFEIDTCENIIVKTIASGMAASKGHHDIYEACKAKLIAWQELTA